MTQDATLSDVGARLRAARVRRGLSQRRIASRARIAPSYLSRIENGKIQPSFGTVQRILRAVRADVLEIVGPQSKGEPKGVCPVTPHGQCLLDLIRTDAEAPGLHGGEYYSPREIKLLRRLAAWMKNVRPDRLRAMEILLQDWGERTDTPTKPD